MLLAHSIEGAVFQWRYPETMALSGVLLIYAPIVSLLFTVASIVVGVPLWIPMIRRGWIFVAGHSLVVVAIGALFLLAAMPAGVTERFPDSGLIWIDQRLWLGCMALIVFPVANFPGTVGEFFHPYRPVRSSPG